MMSIKSLVLADNCFWGKEGKLKGVHNKFGATENVGVKNVGASKMQGWKSREKRVWRAEIPVL